MNNEVNALGRELLAIGIGKISPQAEIYYRENLKVFETDPVKSQRLQSQMIASFFIDGLVMIYRQDKQNSQKRKLPNRRKY